MPAARDDDRATLPELPSDAICRLRTERLDLEPLLRVHAAELFPILADPRLYAFTGDGPPRSQESLAETYARRETRRSADGRELWLNWVIRRREDRAAIGYAQATVSSSRSLVAWVVGTAWQGRGYASEAAQSLVDWLGGLGAPVIEAHVHPGHAASQGVARRAGLRPTARVAGGEQVWILERGLDPGGSS